MGKFFAQEDENKLDSILVFAQKTPGMYQFQSKWIENRINLDLTNLIAQFPGVQIKSYGDVGGLKTAQFRGLSAAHTSFTSDGIALSQTMNGSIDFGQLSANGLKKITFHQYNGLEIGIPLSSKIKGCVIDVSYFGQKKQVDTYEIGSRIGSFGLKDLFSSASYQTTKNAILLGGNARISTGNFPYSNQNGQQTVSAERTENSFHEERLFLKTRRILKNNQYLEVHWSYFQSEKALPGAIIFYSANGNQRLTNSHQLIALKYGKEKTNWKRALQLNYQQENLIYVDSTPVYEDGFFKSNFLAHQTSADAQWLYRGKKTTILLGADFNLEMLRSNKLTSNPIRFQTNPTCGFLLGKWTAQVSGSVIGIHGKKTKIYLLPSISYSETTKKSWTFFGNIRSSFRQASFSELYYQQIGNKNLNPEQAYLFQSGIGKDFRFPNKSKYAVLELKNTLFAIYTKDKIIAIPSKNLFVWTILNIGESFSTGTEFWANLRINNGANLEHVFSANNTVNYCIDITNKNDPTYGHQLSYTPLIASNLGYQLAWKKNNFHFNMNFQGKKYALNQNITNNLIESFALFDFHYNRKFKVAKINFFKINVGVNNLLNKSYVYIRSFPQPGRNFTIQIMYEFH